MKKSVVSALTTALVVGAASTTFAAANPFSDVPAGHWAYNAITQLAADGIIEGYGDGTYLGNRNITRYEMAQMVAKAMAKNPGGVDKALLDKLAAEFSDELNNLGVRVANLEKHADKVKWTGKVEYTYHSFRRDDGMLGALDNGRNKKNVDGYVFRLEPQAEVNDHWTVNARLDSNGDMKDSSTSETRLKRAWAQGDYKNFQVKLGKFEFYTNEHGLVWDTEMSGAMVTFGKDLKGTLFAGRLSHDAFLGATKYENWKAYDADVRLGAAGLYADTDGDGLVDKGDPASIYGLNVQYDKGGDRGFFGGAGYYHLSSENFKVISKDDKANIWSLNAGYKFSPKAKLWASYAQNSKVDFYGVKKNSWQVQFDYGTYDNAKVKGSWSAYLAYRQFGYGATLAGTVEDDVLLGTKGIAVGAAWAPFKNVGILVKYFNGKLNDRIVRDVVGGKDKASQLFGRVELFF